VHHDKYVGKAGTTFQTAKAGLFHTYTTTHVNVTIVIKNETVLTSSYDVIYSVHSPAPSDKNGSANCTYPGPPSGPGDHNGTHNGTHDDFLFLDGPGGDHNGTHGGNGTHPCDGHNGATPGPAPDGGKAALAAYELWESAQASWKAILKAYTTISKTYQL
jgi:hypothetical protein